MNRNKLLLYVSVTSLWLAVVVFTLIQEKSNVSAWSSYAEDEQPMGQVSLESGLATVLYGPLATGDTQVTLNYGKGEVSTTLPASEGHMACRSVFPAGEKHVGVAFSDQNKLDTVVMFAENSAQVFENVVAIDTRLDRIASIQANAQHKLDLIISNFEKTMTVTMELKDHPVSFLENPQIDSAEFSRTHFKIRTAFGAFDTELPPLKSLI